MFESEAGRKLTASLHQPAGDTVDMTDSRRHVPWLPSQGAGGQLGGSERRRGCGEPIAHELWLTMCVIHGSLQRNIWSESGLLCSMCTCVHMDGNTQGQFIHSSAE